MESALQCQPSAFRTQSLPYLDEHCGFMRQHALCLTPRCNLGTGSYTSRRMNGMASRCWMMLHFPLWTSKPATMPILTSLAVSIANVLY